MELYGLHLSPRAWYENSVNLFIEQWVLERKIDNDFIYLNGTKGGILFVKYYVDDIIFGSTKKKMCTEFEKMMHKKFQMSSMGELTFFLGLQVKQKEDGIFISQDKYVTEILKKFGFSDVKTASTPMETHKPLLKDADGEDVDEHLYRSMIGSLMYLTSSRPDIMFAVCACARFQVNPKVLHLHAMKRIFRYLKGQPKLGLWYPKDSPFDLVAFTDSNYAGASLNRKSIIGAEYIAASNCCGQIEHIEIRHHFIRDSNKKKLIQMIKIYTDQNVLDLLPKAFDVSRFQYLIAKKSTENADYVEIVDFLNANPIRYALTVSLTIYVSCIEQFWSTAKTKTINNETQIHAKVEGKTIVISESSMMRDLQFDDEDEVNAVYDTPSHTKKIFANMRRQGKDFSGTVTPLFSSMLAQQADMGEGTGKNGGKDFSGRDTPLFQTTMVQAQEEGEGSEMPTDPQHTPTISQPSISQS
ncbi:putative ribonuclease H-like domain-containing protein [Tanacetum coccineum]